jgi:uncharacterized protein YjbJ (UPF0337 family)
MNSSTHDKVKGTEKEAVGKVKEETGKAIGNPDLRAAAPQKKSAVKCSAK